MKRLLLLPLLLLPVGCVDRLLVIRSEPPGAEVFIDGQSKGLTPWTEKYTWYGTRELTLVKSGYRSERRFVDLDAPWWQVFPFDLITDVMLPFTLEDKVEMEVVLHKEPEAARALEETLQRAAESREKSRLPADAPR